MTNGALRPWLLLSLLCIPMRAQPATATSSELPQQAWEKLFESETLEYEYLAGAAGNEKTGIWLAVGTRPKGKLGGEQNFRIWQVDTAGTRRIDLAVEKLQQAPGATGYRRMIDIVMSADGQPVLYYEAMSGQTCFVRFEAATAKAAPAKSLPDLPAGTFINRAIPMPDRGVLLIGRAVDKALMVKLDEAGTPAWKRVLTEEKLSILLEGSHDAGGFTLLGAQRIEGVYSAWLGRFKADGSIVDRIVFDGRYGSVVKNPSGGYALVYDKAGAKGFNIQLKALSEKLGDTWSTAIASEEMIAAPFRIRRMANGDYLVEGSKERRLFISRYSGKDGQPVWSYGRRDPAALSERLWNFGLLESNSDFYVPFTVVRVDQTRKEQRQIIGLLKFSAK